jgi:hypothetical protein
VGRNKDKAVGTCRLCGSYGPLRKSHLVPQATYTLAREGAPGEPRQTHLVKVNAKGAILTDEQWKEPLLCEGCEQRFGSWEKYAHPLISQPDGTFPWLAGTTHVRGEVANSTRAVDVPTLSLFLVSLFWRLSVYRCPAVALGTYEREFRKYLLVDGTPFPAQARLVVTLLDPSHVTLGRADHGFMTFTGSDEEGYRVDRFMLLGVDLKLFVGEQVPPALDVLCFARTGRVLLGSVDALALEAAPLLISSLPKGSLGRS